MILIKHEKCRVEKAQKVLELIEKFDERIDTMRAAINDNALPVSPRYLKDYKYANIAYNRLINYYQKIFSNEFIIKNIGS